MKKILAFFIILFTIFINVDVFALTLTKDDYINVSGQSIGIKMDTGVFVIKMFEISIDDHTYKPWDNVLNINDKITKIGDINIKTIKDLKKAINFYKDNSVSIEIVRNDEIIKKEIKGVKINNNYSYGIFVKDSLLGVGTLTYVIPNEMTYGALGHSITSNKINGGVIYDSDVKKINPSKNGNVGEKIVEIKDHEIGDVIANKETGIYGNMTDDYFYKEYKIGYKENVHKGDAYILTSILGNDVKMYSIEIIDAYNQDSKNIKSMKVKVTDKRLLDKTGGIVQGMSGSPIIQDGKIIGALTHVVVSNTNLGYGIYIEWMLNDMGIDLKRQ